MLAMPTKNDSTDNEVIMRTNSEDISNSRACSCAISRAPTVAATLVEAHSSYTRLLATSLKEEENAAARDVEWDVGALYTIIPGRVSFAVYKSQEQAFTSSQQHQDKRFVTSQMHHQYQPLCSDFGPVNLGVLHDFCSYISDCMKESEKELVYYTMEAVDLRTNGAFLLATYLVVHLAYTAEKAWEPFRIIHGNAFATFRDASDLPQDYDLTILSCLRSLSKAMALGWYSPSTFDSKEYARLDDPAYADMHMVTPKFAAFRGPIEPRTPQAKRHGSARSTFAPDHFVHVLSSRSITAVVRLNEPSTYNAASFTKAGLAHYDMFFDDCTVPSNSIVLKFLDVAQKHEKLAVHCTAGLGRTGTLIAAYMMRYNGFTAAESIGWLRIVRPGSVIGPQQHYLHFLERAFHPDSRAALPSIPQRSAEQSEAMGRCVMQGKESNAANNMHKADARYNKDKKSGIHQNQASSSVEEREGCVDACVPSASHPTSCAGSACGCAPKRTSIDRFLKRILCRRVSEMVEECETA